MTIPDIPACVDFLASGLGFCAYGVGAYWFVRAFVAFFGSFK